MALVHAWGDAEIDGPYLLDEDREIRHSPQCESCGSFDEDTGEPLETPYACVWFTKAGDRGLGLDKPPRYVECTGCGYRYPVRRLPEEAVVH